MEKLILIPLTSTELLEIDGGIDKNSTAYQVGHVIGEAIAGIGTFCGCVALFLAPKS